MLFKLYLSIFKKTIFKCSSWNNHNTTSWGFYTETHKLISLMDFEQQTKDDNNNNKN